MAEAATETAPRRPLARRLLVPLAVVTVAAAVLIHRFGIVPVGAGLLLIVLLLITAVMFVRGRATRRGRTRTRRWRRTRTTRSASPRMPRRAGGGGPGLGRAGGRAGRALGRKGRAGGAAPGGRASGSRAGGRRPRSAARGSAGKGGPGKGGSPAGRARRAITGSRRTGSSRPGGGRPGTASSPRGQQRRRLTRPSTWRKPQQGTSPRGRTSRPGRPVPAGGKTGQPAKRKLLRPSTWRKPSQPQRRPAGGRTRPRRLPGQRPAAAPPRRPGWRQRAANRRARTARPSTANSRLRRAFLRRSGQIRRGPAAGWARRAAARRLPRRQARATRLGRNRLRMRRNVKWIGRRYRARTAARRRWTTARHRWTLHRARRRATQQSRTVTPKPAPTPRARATPAPRIPVPKPAPRISPTTGQTTMSSHPAIDAAAEGTRHLAAFYPSDGRDFLQFMFGLPEGYFTVKAQHMEMLSQRIRSELATEPAFAEAFAQLAQVEHHAAEAARQVILRFRQEHPQDIKRHEDPRGDEAHTWNVVP